MEHHKIYSSCKEQQQEFDGFEIRFAMNVVNERGATDGEMVERNKCGEGETPEQMNLLDIPESILLKILSFTDHNFLRHVASKVSIAFRRVARLQPLWKNACLTYSPQNCWDENPAEKFVNDLKVTPYLYHLTINIGSDKDDDVAMNALMNTRCQIYKFTLQLEHYGPEVLLFLQRHPEIRELELEDNVETDGDMFTISFAAAVGALLPKLNMLILSHSWLLLSQETGKLIWEPSVQLFEGNVPKEAPGWFPADDTKIVPGGCESLESGSGVKLLDLRDVELGDSGVGADMEDYMKPQAVQGLRHFQFTPPRLTGRFMNIPPADVALATAAMVNNVAALIRSQRNHLRSVSLSRGLLAGPGAPEVFAALGQTRCLEEADVPADRTGAGVRSMLEALSANEGSARLRSLRLDLPAGMESAEAADVVRTLGRCLPALEALELVCDDGGWTSQDLFPGFEAFAGLLERGLRSLQLCNCGPVGRADLEQLVQMATDSPGLQLRQLLLSDCACSAGDAWADCRDRADGLLARALPDLEFDINNSMGFAGADGPGNYDVGFVVEPFCNCERRRGRGGRGRGRGRGHGQGRGN